MSTVGAFLQEMFVLYAIAIVGFIVRKKGILNEHASHVLTPLILYITLPALIIFSLDTSFSITVLTEFLWLVSMSIYILLLSVCFASWMGRRSALPERQRSVYEGIIIFGNQGFIGYAVSFILLGEQGIIYLTMFNICYLILIWTYGIYLFNKEKGMIDWKNIFLNPGILSTIIGLLLFLSPIRLPTTVSNGLELIGKMTIPLSMMMIGILIANVKGFPCKQVTNKYLWKATITRLIIIPLFLLPFFALPVPISVLFIAVVVSGMPSAPTISLYAQKYGADTFFGSLGVLLTTVLCIISIPFLYVVVHFLHY
ncbi:AEC family transporter [Pseudogracilibacillus auburnensis]|uniref:AEC family transporter n=1 Tax=Pseudogracilibacillus auburnensis TaxID=1494959 RepID=UPI001A962BE0|nr:AEC family transporter [Pseudogracilibacillus auburnensis]MBO1003008.1 AEC family transporter [Pseudogracilibacillus auburnensis]